MEKQQEKAATKDELSEAQTELSNRLPSEGSGLTNAELGERMETLEKGRGDLATKEALEDAKRELENQLPADGSGITNKDLGKRIEALENGAVPH